MSKDSLIDENKELYMKEKGLHGVFIPAKVLHFKKIPASAKLLYGEILSLCDEKGFCWASNNHFADLFGVSDKSISRLIASLQKSRFIKCKVEKNNSRKIFVQGMSKKKGAPKMSTYYKGQGSSKSPAIEKNDFKVDTKEWKDKQGHKHGQDSIDYES